MSPHPSVIYEVDRQDRITAVGGAWDEFLQQNPGDGMSTVKLGSRFIIGHSLLDYIQDEGTRLFMRSVLDSVRTLKKTRVVAYRCDAPDEKRFMEMRIDLLARNGLRLTHRIVRTEPLTPSFLVRDVGRDDSVDGLRCSVCNRVQVHSAWVEPDDAPTTSEGRPFRVRHTVCPVCKSSLGLGD